MTTTQDDAREVETDARARILVIDDEVPIRKGLETVLTGAGHEVECVGSAEDAIARALAAPPDLAIVDLQLPGQSGMELISAFQERGIETTVVVLTGNASIDTALAATRQGVYDYLVKPVDRQRLVEVVRKGLERTALRRELLELRREMVRAGKFQHLVGSSPQMMELYRLIEQVAPSDASVLVLGESGTGKELVARTIHQLSSRASSRLVAINCAAIPRRCWRARSSDTNAVRSPARRRCGSAASSARTEGRSSSTRSPRCRSSCRASCCACSRTAGSGASAARARSRSTSA